MEQPKSEGFAGEIDITEDFVVLDDATTFTSQLDLSNLRKRKTKIISSAKETIENGKFHDCQHLRIYRFPRVLLVPLPLTPP